MRGLATPRGVAVIPSQFSLLRGLVASVCLVLGTTHPLILPKQSPRWAERINCFIIIIIDNTHQKIGAIKEKETDIERA